MAESRASADMAISKGCVAGGRSHGCSWEKGHWRREGSGERLSGRIRLARLTLRLIPADRRGHDQAEAGQRQDGRRED